MANKFLRSGDGNDADDGSTWALAKASIDSTDGAAFVAAAGDTIYVSGNHAESTASGLTATFAGTLASPVRVLCVDDTGDPASPTALATTATITTTGASSILMSGVAYIYGITFSAGSGAVNQPVLFGNTNNSFFVVDTCVLKAAGTGTAVAAIRFGASGISGIAEVTAINCTFEFGATGQVFSVCGTGTIRGGGASASGSDPTNFCSPNFSAGEGFNLLVDGFDFTNWGSAYNLVLGGAVVQPGRAIFRNCKMHSSSWTGLLVSTPFTAAGFRAEMWNCSAGDINYAMRIEDCAGSIRDETTIVHTGGASDGDTTITWKMVSSANAEYPVVVLRSPEIFVPNTTTGSSKTLTVEIAQDGTTTALNDDEIWLEVEYLGTSGFPLALFADDAKADVLATAAAQANSSETWSGLSGTNKKQALSATFTPQEEGVYLVTVCLAKASTTVYVDPKVTVT